MNEIKMQFLDGCPNACLLLHASHHQHRSNITGSVSCDSLLPCLFKMTDKQENCVLHEICHFKQLPQGKTYITVATPEPSTFQSADVHRFKNQVMGGNNLPLKHYLPCCKDCMNADA